MDWFGGYLENLCYFFSKPFGRLAGDGINGAVHGALASAQDMARSGKTKNDVIKTEDK